MSKIEGSSQSPIRLDVDESDVFEDWNANDWIGCGRVWSDIPDYVQAEKMRLLTVPNHFAELLPAEDNTVNHLLKYQIPLTIEKTDITHDIHLAFNADPPDSSLQITLGQSWLDSNQSVRSTNTNLALPFWVLTFFSAARKARISQKRWQDAINWAHKVNTGTGIRESFLRTLSVTPWSGPIPGVWTDGQLEDLWRLLGDIPLESPLLNAMLTVASLRLKSESSTAVLTTDFSNAITYRATMDGSEAQLSSILSRIHSFNYRKVLVIVHYPEFHWGACLIDLDQRIVRFGDGLHRGLPSIFTQNLLVWLKESFQVDRGEQFEVMNDLPCRRQKTIIHAELLPSMLLSIMSLTKSYERRNKPV
ncbi:hypothetical protein K435DRAFT_801570 [Dendrothele bispora CBS 962.96]|uniref:Ubiquitin-like protease family profile domain-containing protein n=1 Tax=Dendrothele bispora (strain CBS 962.96) TaxID=1314807 RepID=A0A4S8LNX6_DENBC|nr:hypothetical protein K435DRAFT_801570 [Dendrothele bispora CBS 962.96]